MYDLRFAIFFVFQFLFLTAKAQVATVTGSAPNFIGKEILLVVYDDPISGTERVLDRTVVDSRGGFTLKGETEPVQYGFVQVGRECGDLFLESGKAVTVRFAPAKRPRGPEGFNDRYFFRLDFIDGEGVRLNRDIIRYNDRLDAFLPRVYSLMKSRKNPKAMADSVDAFRTRTSVEFPVESGYLAEYMRYSIANVEQTFIMKKEVLYDRYLKGRPAQPWNPEFMRFIEQFHEGLFTRLALLEKRNESIAAMKKTAAFTEMEGMLRSKPFMEDDFTRRAVLISGLGQLYGQKGFDDQRTSAVLKGFSKTAAQPALARAARNIADKKDRMRPGTAAPSFQLTDTEGWTHAIEDFKGVYLFVEVTEANNAYCLQEAAVLRDMQKRFPSIRFLTLLVDASEREVVEFKRDFAPERPVVPIGRNDRFMADHAISSLPSFFIVDSESRLYRSPALDPSKGGISELETLEQTAPSKRYKVGGR
jgi:hypothetical protein